MTRVTKLTIAAMSMLLLACASVPPDRPDPPAPPPEGVQSAQVKASPSSKTIPYGLPAEPASIKGPARVPDGTQASFTASGLGFGEPITVWFNDNVIYRDFADANGKYAFTHVYKSAPRRQITVRVEGKKSGRTATFSYVLT